MPNRDFFTSHGAYVKLRYIALIRLEISRKTRLWCLKCVIVYLAQAIPAIVMNCANGTYRSSLLIESTDSMISTLASMHCQKMEIFVFSANNH